MSAPKCACDARTNFDGCSKNEGNQLKVTAVQIDQFCKIAVRSALVKIDDVQGSTPRNLDAFMLVSERDVLGTIGGGQLEYMAIDDARRALRDCTMNVEKTVQLGPQTGQCCGGQVRLLIINFTAAEKHELQLKISTQIEQYPHVFIFGAGHVGRDLAMALAPLPFHVTLVDERETELALDRSGVALKLHMLPEQVVREAPAHSAFVVATHDHALDFQITGEALARGDAAYVGMIGSKTKRAVFSNWLKANSQDPSILPSLVCPIGGKNVGNKCPEVIAALVAAELLLHTKNCEWDGQSPTVPRMTDLGVA